MNAPLLRRLPCLTLLLTLAVPSLARAATVQVPSAKYPTLQSGIDAAQSGDTVLVKDGTYKGDGNRDLDFFGKSLTVKSLHGAAKTTLDCQGSAAYPHRGFFLHHGELTATIEGFRVGHGYTVGEAVPHSPNPSSSVFSGDGGGICINIRGSAVVKNCNFNANAASSKGGGIYLNSQGSAVVTDCTFSDNTASSAYSGCYGGGAYIAGGSGVAVINSTFSGNTAGSPPVGGYGGAAFLTLNRAFGNIARRGSVVVTNCIAWGSNSTMDSPLAAEFFSSSRNLIKFTYSDIESGAPGMGNINKDPQFVNAAKGDLHLRSGSPCFGAGTHDGAPATDLDGNTRPNPPSMGAYEQALPSLALDAELNIILHRPKQKRKVHEIEDQFIRFTDIVSSLCLFFRIRPQLCVGTHEC